MNKRLEVFVSSVDSYSDAWQYFFILFDKYWPDCVYPVNLMSNKKRLDKNRVNTIPVGDIKEWGLSIKKALKLVQADYVLLLFEDFFINKKIDSFLINKYFKFMIENDLDYFRLKASPPPLKKRIISPNIGKIKFMDAYNCSCQPAIYKKEVLIKLIEDDFTPWDFEIKGSINNYRLKKSFVGVYQDVISFYVGIIGGEWNDTINQFLQEHDLEFIQSKRKIRNNFSYSKTYFFVEKIKNIYYFRIKFKVMVFLNIFKLNLKSILYNLFKK